MSNIEPEIVYCYNTDYVRAKKNTSHHPSNNLWDLEMKNRDGYWISVATMYVDDIEPILARPESLTMYPEN